MLKLRCTSFLQHYKGKGGRSDVSKKVFEVVRSYEHCSFDPIDWGCAIQLWERSVRGTIGGLYIVRNS